MPKKKAATKHSGANVGRLQQWMKLRRQLDELEEVERRLRQDIAKELAPQLLVNGGSQRLLVGPLQVDVDVRMNTTIDRAMVVPTLARLPRIERLRILRYKPELDVKVFNKLPTELQKVVERMLVRRAGLPALSVKPQSK